MQRDVQQAAAELAIELLCETAATLFGRLSGLSVSSERLHTVTNQVAKGLIMCWRWRHLGRRLIDAWRRSLPGAFAVRCWSWGWEL